MAYVVGTSRLLVVQTAPFILMRRHGEERHTMSSSPETGKTYWSGSSCGGHSQPLIFVQYARSAYCHYELVNSFSHAAHIQYYKALRVRFAKELSAMEQFAREQKLAT